MDVEGNLVSALLDDLYDFRQEVNSEHIGAERLNKHDALQAVLLEDPELMAQPPLSSPGDSIYVPIERKAPAIALPVRGMRRYLRIDRYRDASTPG